MRDGADGTVDEGHARTYSASQYLCVVRGQCQVNVFCFFVRSVDFNRVLHLVSHIPGRAGLCMFSDATAEAAAEEHGGRDQVVAVAHRGGDVLLDGDQCIGEECITE